MRKIKILSYLFLFSFIFGEDLYFGMRGDVETLDPASQWSDTTSLIIANVYDTLLTINPKTWRVSPSLAVKWESSSDGLVWTFYLRKNVKFSDGTLLTSKDVVYSLNRELKHESGKFLFYYVKEIKQDGPYKVIFVLKKKFSPFLHVLTAPQASVVKYSPDGFKPIGSGPYFVSLWEKGKRMILKRNPYYWGTTGNIDRIIILMVSSIDTTYSLMLNGKIDITDWISMSRVDALKNYNRFYVFSQPILSLEYLVFNPKDPWTANLNVRKALSYLWNPRWVSLTFGQYMEPACRVIPYPNEKCLWKFSPSKAKKVIKSQGLWGKVKVRLVYPSDPLYSRIFVPYSYIAKKSGIEIKLLPIRAEKLDNMYLHMDYSLAYYSWIWDYPEPQNMLAILLPKGKLPGKYPNLSGFKIFGFLRSILDAAIQQQDQEKRTLLYKKIENKLYKYKLLIPVSRLKKTLFVNRRIKNIIIDPSGVLKFKNINKQ